MQGRTLSDLTHFLELDGLKLNDSGKLIRHLVLESQKVKPGDVYIAYQGARFDGHDFIDDVVKKGALAVISERQVKASIVTLVEPNIKNKLADLARWFYIIPEQLKIIAVTGTNGKTSITCLYAQLAMLFHDSCGVLGTIGNGLWPSLKVSDRTTDNSLMLWQSLVTLAKRTRQVAMEASSHALDQGRLSGLHLSTVIWSNLSHDHLDYHRTLECYFRAKLKLFTDYQYQFAIINYDDQWGQKLLEKLQDRVTYSYSICSKKADFYLEILMKKRIGYRVCLHFKGMQVFSEINLVGKFNLENIAAVICAYLAKGVSLKLIASRLPDLLPVPGRMEIIKTNQRPFVVLDYAHTPDALEKALVTVRSQMNGSQRLWCVFGCGGDRDVSKRAIMASIAETLSDMIIATSDNPRSELQELIFQDMGEGFQNIKPILFMEDRKQAIEYALTHAGEDDWVLIAGKGHERYQEINDRYFLFDEKEIIDSFCHSAKLG